MLTLSDYTCILEKRRPARHTFARGIPAGTDNLTSLSEESLWAHHGEGMRLFEDAWSSGEAGEPVAGPSLLDLKHEIALRILESCRLCERRCGVNRRRGELGFCGVGETSRLASEFLHLGEEPELVPSHTLFFCGCTFRCAYCQNWDFALDPGAGVRADPADLAERIAAGCDQGSRNANFVGGNPDPHLHTILDVVRRLPPGCSHLPMVWNSNMYLSEEAMLLTAGVMDIYLADWRYGNDACAERYSEVANYFAVVSRNFAAAARQGEVMLRQLMLPGHLDCCTLPILRWAAEHLPGVYFNLMFQYRPEYRASLWPELDRRLSAEEKHAALEAARSLGLNLS